MEFDSREGFLEDLKRRAGDGLRAVSVYEQEDYEALYVREDVNALYGEEMYDAAHEGMILEGMGSDYLESLFAVGELRCAMYGFESAFIFHLLGSEYDGLVVSLDADTDVPLGSFVDACAAGIDVVL